jgi:hypothetical protein
MQATLICGVWAYKDNENKKRNVKTLRMRVNFILCTFSLFKGKKRGLPVEFLFYRRGEEAYEISTPV